MAAETLVQHFHQHTFCATAEMGTQPIGEKEGRAGRDTSSEQGILRRGETDRGDGSFAFLFHCRLPAPICIGGILHSGFLEVTQGFATLQLFLLQYFKFFSCHNNNSCSFVHYCSCKGTTELQLLQRGVYRMLTGQKQRTA